MGGNCRHREAQWIEPDVRGGAGRFTNLRAALLALCPLNEDQTEWVNESMEILAPRSGGG